MRYHQFFHLQLLLPLLPAMVLDVILIPAEIVFHQLQTHWGVGRDIKATEERASLS